MYPLVERVIINYYEKVIRLQIEAIDMYGFDKVVDAMDMFGEDWYAALVRCEENHLQGECVLCMYD